MPSSTPVNLSTEPDAVIVEHPEIRSDRMARLYFLSVLGASAIERGWRCPRRREPLETLVVRINQFLLAKGWTVGGSDIASRAIENDAQRKRSFERTRDEATTLRATGKGPVGLDQVEESLKRFGWDASARQLRPHQQSGLIHALTAVNSANFSVPGSGKTATTLATAVAHFAANTIDLVLVVGPLACFAPWETEARIALAGKMVVTRIRGSAFERTEQYKALHPGQIALLSYASAATDQTHLIALCKAHRVMLVVDESHRIKRFRGGLWAPALTELARYARVRTILSGTPMPQSGRDLYSQLNVLWPNAELTVPRDSFADRVEKDFPSLLEEVRPFIARTPKAALGLPSYEVHRHEVPLRGTQSEVYDLVLNQFRRQLADAETWRLKLEALRRGRPIRLLQAVTNPDLLNRVDGYYQIARLDTAAPTLLGRLASYRDSETPAKSLAALELLRPVMAAGQKAVCWSTFVPNLDHLSALVRAHLTVPCFQIDGRIATGDEALEEAVLALTPTEAETREQIIERFLRTEGPAVLITNPASCSESISLHRACHTAIYVDRTYDCAQFLQSIDRIHRLGLPPNVQVNIHLLLATFSGQQTVDHLVDAALRRKEGAMRALLEGAELRPFHLGSPIEDAEGTDEDLAALLRYLLGETA